MKRAHLCYICSIYGILILNFDLLNFLSTATCAVYYHIGLIADGLDPFHRMLTVIVLIQFWSVNILSYFTISPDKVHLHLLQYSWTVYRFYLFVKFVKFFDKHMKILTFWSHWDWLHVCRILTSAFYHRPTSCRGLYTDHCSILIIIY